MGATRDLYLQQQHGGCPGACAEFLCHDCRAAAQADKHAAVELKETKLLLATAYSNAEVLMAERNEAVKAYADGCAERIELETFLLDALMSLQFYADTTNWTRGSAAQQDAGKRGRVALNRILDRGAKYGRLRAVRT